MTATKGRTKVIDETTDLGMAMLIVESDDGNYQPVRNVSTIREARELAGEDVRFRMRRLEQGADPLCPSRYRVWAQDASGEYATVAEIDAN